MARNRSEKFGGISDELMGLFRQEAIGPKTARILVEGTSLHADYYDLTLLRRAFYRNLIRVEAGLEPTTMGIRENKAGADA